MCGIAGILRHSTGAPVSADALACMTGTLLHRGPDDQGLFVSAHRACGLGARRLSIIDLMTGHQPLSNEACVASGVWGSRCWVVQNGEIYNYRSLRTELEAHGHRFQTQSDTEVIVHAYEQWGLDFVTRLWGMFALAVWDEGARRLILARDRFGIKPLVYTQAGGFLLFASEIKALLQHPHLAPRLDPRSLEDMFTVGFVPGPNTIWREIRKLPPAHLLVAQADVGSLQVRRYWDAPFRPAGEEEAVDQVQAAELVFDLLRDSVRLRLQSDVPVGALLSGGLDSSGVVALMQELSGGHAHTFSIGFEAASHDESRHAQEAARHIGTEHHILHFDQQAFDHLPQVMAALDQPQCFATAVPIWLLYRACHQAGFKVILTGEGSDELFAGYHWFAGNRHADRLMPLPLLLRRPLFAPALPWPISTGAGQVLRSADRSAVGRYLAWLQVSGAGQRADLFTAQLRDALQAADRPSLAQRWQEEHGAAVQPLAPLHRDLTLERHLRLPDFINHEVDAVSMAHSVEARVPFLDHRLWEALARWRPHLKVDRGKPEKWLLREALARRDPRGRLYLPPGIRRRRKQGLATPHAAWWCQAPMPDWVEGLLSPEALDQAGLFRPETIGHWRSQHRRRGQDFSALLTGVLNVQVWQASQAQGLHG